MTLYSVELEPEVATWLRSLSDREFAQVDVYVGMLAERATTLGEPWSRNLGEGVRELRFHLHPRGMRITPRGFRQRGTRSWLSIHRWTTCGANG
ncbi:type II toxin-antitoxin system RelE/ParE family toxin [Nocardia asteroides]|uniref:type II toxin-antitoxin system RelE/ParE family toxin n=1 Tax=Nocardia asteroides TaxID=1824 RepID=UPI00341F1E96